MARPSDHESVTSIAVALDRVTRALADRYTVQRELGRGGMATVYLARDVRHEREVAIKVLHPDLGAVLGAERFLSEIKTTAKLQHPHILPLLDSGAADGLLYYVMPLVTGETLRARLDRERQLPVDDAARLGREVASALAHAHKQGIIHRDIKPENILLQDGAAVVADFGIALAVSNAGGQRVTQTGLSLGTPQYMSPEQATGDRVIDARADIYSLGAVLYEMLSGEPPHTGSTAQAVIARLLTEEPRALSVTRKQVPAHVEAAVQRALEKLPADRFASAREFAEALEGRGHATTRVSTGTRAGSGTRRRSSVLLAVAGVLVAAVGVGGFLAGRRTNPMGRDANIAQALSRPLLSFDVTFSDSINTDSPQPFGAAGDRLFLPNPNGRSFIYSLSDRSLTAVNTSGVASPRISPNGAWLSWSVFGVVGSFTLKVRPTAGGVERLVADSIIGSTWQDDSTLFVAARRGAGVDVQRIGLGPGAAGPESVVTLRGEKDVWVVHVYLFAMPGSGQLLLESLSPSRVDTTSFRRQLSLVDLARRTQTTLTGMLPEGHVVSGVLPNGYLLSSVVAGEDAIFATPFDWRSGRMGTTTPVAPVPFVARTVNGTLVFAPRPPSALAVVTRDGASRILPGTELALPMGDPQVSPDRTMLAYGVQDFATATKHVYTYALPNGPATRIASFRGRTGEPISGNVHWAPDGQSIYSFEYSCECLLRTTRDGARSDTVARRTIGTGTSVLAVFRASDGTDGLVVSDRKRGVIVVDVRGDSTLSTIIPPRTSLDVRVDQVRVSPDGQWLAHWTRSRNGTSREIFLTRMSGGGDRWRIPFDGAGTPVWSRTGRELFFIARDTLRAAELTFTPTPTVRTIRTLFRVTGRAQAGFDALPGDAAFVLPVPVGGAPRVTVLVNFADEVARLVGPRPPAR